MRIAREFTGTCFAPYEQGKINLELELAYIAAYECEVQEDYASFAEEFIPSVLQRWMMMLYADGCDPEKADDKVAEVLDNASAEIREYLAQSQGQLIALRIPSVSLAQDSQKIYERTAQKNDWIDQSAMMAAMQAAVMAQQAPAPQPVAAAQGVRWICSCGSINSGKFCTECGSPKNFDRLLCSCGKEGSGKFCTECGRPLC